MQEARGRIGRGQPQLQTHWQQGAEQTAGARGQPQLQLYWQNAVQNQRPGPTPAATSRAKRVQNSGRGQPQLQLYWQQGRNNNMG